MCWPPHGYSRVMSNSPWQQSGGGRDPRQPFGQPARDPRAPFGQQPASPYGAPMPYSPPPRKPVWPWLVGALALIAAIVLVVAFWPANEPEPLPDQPAAPSAFPSPTLTGNAIPYEGNGTGVVEITNQRWTNNGLEVDYRITADDKTNYFAIFTFANDTRESYEPENDELIEVRPGQPAVGTVSFNMPRTNATFVLASSSGRASTALPVSG